MSNDNQAKIDRIESILFGRKSDVSYLKGIDPFPAKGEDPFIGGGAKDDVDRFATLVTVKAANEGWAYSPIEDGNFTRMLLAWNEIQEVLGRIERAVESERAVVRDTWGRYTQAPVAYQTALKRLETLRDEVRCIAVDASFPYRKAFRAAAHLGEAA